MKLNSIATQTIPRGSKFIALYGDGSGAQLFMTDKKGNLFGHDGKPRDSEPEAYLMDSCFTWWIKLPNSYKLWFEQKENP